MRKLAMVLALSSTALATPVLARDGSFYIGVEGGAMIVEDLDLDIGGRNNVVTVDHKYGFDVDYIAGYDFGPVRLEAELGYKRAKVDEFQQVAGGGFAGGTFNGSGRTEVISSMINALLDFGDDNSVNGYVGGGVGIAQLRFRNVNGNLAANQGAVFLDDKDAELAWQAIAGIRAAVTPNVDIGLKYRFFNTTRFDMIGETVGGGFATGPVSTRFPTQSVSGKLRTHSLLASLIYNFGGPEPVVVPEPIITAPVEPAYVPPAEPVAPTPVPVGPFIVFFDWDRSDITPEAASILDNAAAAYQQTGSASVMLAGNADKSGSAQYNVGLSQRRADAVRAYMVGRGLPDGSISTEAYGESRPLVDTADGVREPQNRNVQITFGPNAGM
ncbi:MAG TPA: OmpA family protein [Sphingomonadaceae bacterium]|nr:OmpA family protein [Sphingomonadaceae bacterium]